MGRGVLSGLVMGAVFSVMALAATSLMLPLPQRPEAPAPLVAAPEPVLPAPVVAVPAATAPAPLAFAPAADAIASAPSGASEAAPAAIAPLPDAPAEVVANGSEAAAPAIDLAAAAPMAEPAPAAAPATVPGRAAPPAIIEVPAGSEFARAPGDVLALRPGADAAPAQTNLPAAPLAAVEVAPAVEGTDPAARPAAPSGPVAPGAPVADLASPALPHAEQPLPVPPPGEAFAPVLSAAALSDLPASPDVLAAPAAAASALAAPVADATPEAAAVADRPAAASTPQAAALPDIILVPDTVPSSPAAAALPQPGFATAAAPGFANAPGVAVNRLPSIGSAPAPVNPTPPAEALRPIVAYGTDYTATGAPMLALVLLDPGAGADIGALQALGLPLTIALDPMRAGARDAAAAYRAAGFEVAILAQTLPTGATPTDLEVALADWRRVLPEAVALVEPPEPVLQGNRSLAQQLVAVLAREGLGLATQSGKGLNAAEQLAAAAGVPQAAIWRVLDTETDKAPAIRRYLDRAAFEAARGKGVAVMLRAWPETLAGLAEWQAGREGGPELAPLSALALAGGPL
ncbi:divergent polysaccharide deacetylase family protein [Phaeovulum sp.]|uniref:divergent polysaccharide deacetylase family protein n=1 Tax=Phaeovulum sp. TaxID=2934796 RepID=UPI0027304C35|nr:divergent polysaccharide deacetylase family protein [Phaeovulum sp.]MDP1670336.1 divergent polysaccharide deacetylase family protein [Phaeovulum sp.]MDZ4120665.1 divergent polysaccharide deacetylase family protein [Phaeovulum sp.]